MMSLGRIAGIRGAADGVGGYVDQRLPAYTIAGLRGALDISTAPALRERLLGMLSPGVKQLTIDLSEVSSCDVAGLAVLIGTQRRATALTTAVTAEAQDGRAENMSR